MRCPDCLANGATHTVENGREQNTRIPYTAMWDENDVLHDHNPNTYSMPYTCSNGHAWTVTAPSVPCRAHAATGCGWLGPNPPLEGTETNVAAAAAGLDVLTRGANDPPTPPIVIVT